MSKFDCALTKICLVPKLDVKGFLNLQNESEKAPEPPGLYVQIVCHLYTPRNRKLERTYDHRDEN